jgi:hypothetical protein
MNRHGRQENANEEGESTVDILEVKMVCQMYF